jgi:hypothetical protein
LPFAAGKEDSTPFIHRKLETCTVKGQRCYQITKEESVNPYSECCEGNYCKGGIWGATCQVIPDGYTMPFPNPRGGENFTYVPLSGTETDYDSCSEAKNFGPMLSESTDYQLDFPILAATVNLANPGRDDSIGFFVKGDYISEQAAEVEGKIVVLGDFVIERNGANSLVHAGKGSGIVPNDGQDVMTGE